MTAAWLAIYLIRNVVSEYLRIDWEIVGRYINCTLNDIEPERTMQCMGEGHGKNVLTRFYRQLTSQQLSPLRVVTGDGAK